MTELRIAAVGDIHLGEDVRGQYRKSLDGIGDRADILMVAERPDPARHAGGGQGGGRRAARPADPGRGRARQPRLPLRHAARDRQ
ncbi:hypothetical protein ACFSTC_08160 [Nonomuraea ferruginea]